MFYHKFCAAQVFYCEFREIYQNNFYTFIVIRRHSLKFVVTCCHSSSLVVPLIVIRCTNRRHSLPFIVICCTTRCHSIYYSPVF